MGKPETLPSAIVNLPEEAATSSRSFTAASQFAAVTGGSGATQNSRQPSTSTTRWEHSTFLACLMCTTYETSDWETIVGNPIGNQLYFYSYTTAKNAYNNGSPIFSGSGSSLKYGSNDIKDVYVVGYGSVTSFPNLFTNYSPTSWSRNIYYNYE